MKKLTLYHGTNSRFLDSIKQHGLGGINIVAQMNVLPLFKELHQLASSELKKEYDFVPITYRWTINSICNQSAGSQINWQHGDVYLTPSVNRAMSFAVQNKYGSELFTYLKSLIDFIDKHSDARAQAILAKYPAVNELLNQEGRPIVFELTDLVPSDLLDEGGLPADTFFQETLHYLDTLSDEEKNEKDNPLDIIAFRLKQPLAFDRLIVHEVKIKNN
jgi:hypothetical protein